MREPADAVITGFENEDRMAPGTVVVIKTEGGEIVYEGTWPPAEPVAPPNGEKIYGYWLAP